MAQAKRKRQPYIPSVIGWRVYFVSGIMLLLFVSLVARATYIQVLEPGKLERQSDMRSLRTKTTQVQRGMISDRNGVELAVSVPVQTVWADPKVIAEHNTLANKPRRWQALADILELDVAELQRAVANPKRRFVYLKRQVSSPAVADYISKLKLDGVYLKNESRRYYPTGEVSAHLVGVTNIDDRGIEGIEAAFNDWLTGTPGKRQIRKDRSGRTVEQLQVIEEAQQPGDIRLSIDQRIQALAYQELKKATEYLQATSGSVVVLDIDSGEILAMVNTPSFNPNNRHELKPHRMRNRAITDTFEPGSTVKPMVVAGALASGKVKPDKVIDTSPGWMMLGGSRVKDSRNHGEMALGEILQKSSNVGISKLALEVGADDLLENFYALGLGSSSGSMLTGESSGYLTNRRRWSDFELATLSFGYGLTVTPLQLARVYAILGAAGTRYPLSIMKRDAKPVGEAVIAPRVARQMISMLEAVTQEGGTGIKARVKGYRVAGKTGTARKAVAGGYGDNYVATFAGLAPASDPKLAIAVVINEPSGDKYYGGDTAAPVFSKVMGGALHYLNIRPDAQRATIAGVLQ